MKSARVSALMVGGASLCLAVTACGGGGHPAAAPGNQATTAGPNGASTNVVLAAYTHTMAAHSARITLDETVTVGSSAPVRVTGGGLVDLKGSEGQFSLTVPKLGTITELFISPEVYLQLPAKSRGKIPGHKPWLSLNVNKVYKATLGATLSQLSSSSQMPTQTLSYLQAVSSAGVHRIRTVTLGGVATTEYAATIDLSKVEASKTPAVKAAISKLEALLHGSTYPVQIWIDRRDNVRQIAYQFSIPGAATSAPRGNVSLTMGFSDFGAPLHLMAPPKDQTYDITDQTINAGTTTN